MSKKFLIRVYEDRKRSRSFTISSNMSLDGMAEMIQTAVKNIVPSVRHYDAHNMIKLCHNDRGDGAE